MKILWCWRCEQEVPMLDDEEYQKIYQIYGECFETGKKDGQKSVVELFKPVMDEYEKMTGMPDCHYNAILHHKISMYGPPCKQCGKPLRTSKARFCAACGDEVSF